MFGWKLTLTKWLTCAKNTFWFQGKNEELDKALKEAGSGREESDDRTQILEKLTELEAQKENLLGQIRKFEGCDPEVLEKLQKQSQTALEATNRWTDNIFALQSWISKKFPSINIEDMNKQFEIPEDLDYVE